MAEIEDWSLQAIVRGSSGDYTKFVDDENEFLANNEFNRESLASFPDIFEVSRGYSDELEELYKSFYPGSHSLPVQTVLDFEIKQPQINGVGEEDKQHVSEQSSDQVSGSSSVARVSSSYTPKYKRRKNQHKRVVMQVSAEGLTSDLWAWRKYGQKPIKGSPYPRSYYRCSSLKGCLARKQVEKSCTDPGMFIITYTAEHSHSQPTRRNSLAGTVRQKFPSNKTPNNKTGAKQEKADLETSTSQIKAEVVTYNQTRMKEEKKEEMVKGERHDDDDFMMSDFVFNEDFFSGLEDFNEFIGEPVCHAQQFPVRSYS